MLTERIQHAKHINQAVIVDTETHHKTIQDHIRFCVVAAAIISFRRESRKKVLSEFSFSSSG